MQLPLYSLTENTRSLLLRVLPLMEAVDLNDMPQYLQESVTKMEKATGVTTQDHTKRLLILNANGVITDDEYVLLTHQLSDTKPAEGTLLH